MGRNREYRAEYHRKYRQTPHGKKVTLRAIRNYEKKHPDRKKVWGKAIILKKQPCKVCGGQIVHRHHKNYDKPMEIEFLCPLHHKQIHIK